MQNEHSDKYEYNVMFGWGKPGMYIPESDLEPYTEPEKIDHFPDPAKMVNWEQRRYELAKELMKGLATNSNEDIAGQSIDSLVACSVSRADKLIKELRKWNKE